MHRSIAGKAATGADGGRGTAATFVTDSPARAGAGRGKVFLVGAGPGDPELLTLRAVRVLQAADVIVYDKLVPAAIVALGRSTAERIFVGKERGNHALPQERIDELLVELGCRGLCVVRLKGGDPYVFGRGGEEAQALAAAGVEFEVVPGVTAACAAGAIAGIPLTHRDFAHACTFVAGHLKDGTMNLDWGALCRPMTTVVVYMGLTGLALLCRELVAHGLPASKPAAVVQEACLPGQRVMVGTLGDLAERVAAAGFRSPSLVIVGEVVALRSCLGQESSETSIRPRFS